MSPNAPLEVEVPLRYLLAGLTVAAAVSAQSGGGAVSNRQFTVDTFRGLAF